MFRSRVFVHVALVALVAFAAAGCNLRGVRIQLRGFDENQVRGLWLWRAAPSGDFERHAQIVFGALQEQDGIEFLPYSFDLDGKLVTLSTPIERAAGSEDDLNVVLAFGRPLPGAYKLSSYNAAGESSLSDGTLNY
jgi:hypothetical protein